MNEFDVILGQWIAEKRTDKGMTQQEVADRMHVNRSTVHYWEKGKRQMYATTLVDLCEVLDANLEEFSEFYHARVQR